MNTHTPPATPANRPGNRLNVLLATVVYTEAAALRKLIASARCDRHRLSIDLFVHSEFPDVRDAVRDVVCQDPRIRLRPEGFDAAAEGAPFGYGHNRGLARSWNDAAYYAYSEPGAFDACLLVNCDVEFAPGDLDTLAEATAHAPEDVHIVTCTARHAKHGPDTGIGYSAFGLTRAGWEKLGAFDENYFPVYAEDCDYGWRARLAGMREGSVRLGLIHGGSSHLYEDNGDAGRLALIRQRNGVTQQANHDYHRRKWGGEPGLERFQFPFDATGDISAFGRETATRPYYIDPRTRHAPYGPGFDRTVEERLRLTTI